MSFLAKLRAKLLPITRKAVVTRTPLRSDGRPAASVQIENGVSAYILTEQRLSPGDVVKVRLAPCGWELAS